MKFFSKKRIFQFIIVLVSGFFVVSCKLNYATVNIQNIEHAKEELPSEIQSITLMNRSLSNQFQDYPEDSLQQYFYRRNFQLSKIVLDSIASDTCLRALGALMFESHRYDVVIPVERNFPRELSYEQLPDLLTKTQVQDICTRFNTDALLVLERFFTKSMADFSEQRFDTSNGQIHSYNATLDLKYHAFFRVYVPNDPVMIKEINVNDTIYWESDDNTLDRLFGNLPSVKKALISAGIKAALDADNLISPSWIDEKRVYFLFNKSNDQGQKFIEANDFVQAEKYWQDIAQSKNAKIRSKAEYNLALISELNGDLDKAIEYGLKSFYSQYRYQTELYLKRLQARKEALSKTQ